MALYGLAEGTIIHFLTFLTKSEQNFSIIFICFTFSSSKNFDAVCKNKNTIRKQGKQNQKLNTIFFFHKAKADFHI